MTSDVGEVVQHVCNDGVTGGSRHFSTRDEKLSHLGGQPWTFSGSTRFRDKKDGQMKKMNRRQISVVKCMNSLY